MSRPDRTQRFFLGRTLVIGAGPLWVACVVDPNARCDENYSLQDNETRCVCDEGFAFTDDGCVRCKANEVAGLAGCECEDGFTRPSPDSKCAKVSSDQGAACAGDQPCEGDEYDFCQVTSSESGYCTQTGCKSSDDCSGSYECDPKSDGGVCLRPPVGAGKACTSSRDCEGTEATYCETFVGMICLVEGCSTADDDCFVGSECCDLSGFGISATVCVPEGMCP